MNRDSTLAVTNTCPKDDGVIRIGLTSTISCTYANEQHHGRDSMAFGRDLMSMVWFTIVTLRESATAP